MTEPEAICGGSSSDLKASYSALVLSLWRGPFSLLDVQGSVAKSTHAGIPWLRRIREEVGDEVHFWPFDGWQVPDNVSVIAEIYPSIFRNRYAKEDRTADQQDAYVIARWLTETDKRGFLKRHSRSGN